MMAVFDALTARPRDAVVLRGAGRDWRAGELLEAVDALAARLAGCRVLAVLADNGPAWAIADLAALSSGTVHLPLPAFFSPSQLAHALEQTGADAMLTDQPDRIAGLELGFSATGQWEGLTWMQRTAEPASLPEGTAKVSFTSGSTGTPKGVCLSAEGLMDTAAAVAEGLADLTIARHVAALPLSLLLENVAGIHAPLLRGAEVHLPGLQSLGWRGMAGFDPAALDRAVGEIRPNTLILVPELLKAWTAFLEAAGKAAPEGLSYVAVGGARVDPVLLSRARKAGLPAFQGYGLTECGSVVSLNRPGEDGAGVGRPLGHVSVRVEGGEIKISARAFLGYIDGNASARAGTGTREFATGDLGHVDAQGHLHLSGRRKNLLITSYGRNVSPEWVEAGLLAEPAIAQAVVMGDGWPGLGAAIVPAAGASHEAVSAAVERANRSLPDYARVGRWIAAAPFTLQNGQATGNGRPVRQSILARYAAQLAALYDEEETADVVL